MKAEGGPEQQSADLSRAKRKRSISFNDLSIWHVVNLLLTHRELQLGQPFRKRCSMSEREIIRILSFSKSNANMVAETTFEQTVR
jgi:hypothetical protein